MTAVSLSPATGRFNRRSDKESVQVGLMNDGTKRYFDHNHEITVVKIFSGDCYVSDQPGEMLVTILGCCVAACIRDPIIGVGGMNHFLLPGTLEDGGDADDGKALRYGVYAMEQLINEILKRGGNKSRLEIKLFGGGNVTNNSAAIGSKNALFVQEFFRKEGLAVATEDLGGDLPRRIHYYSDTGKVMMRKLKRREDMVVVEEEQQFDSLLRKTPLEGSIDLF